MDHEELIAELPILVEKLTPAERIQLARERRSKQLQKNFDYEELLLAEGRSNPDRRQKLRFTAEIALLEATSRNDVDEVVRLLAEGADPNSHNEDGLTPLHQCAIDNNEALLAKLLEFGADVNSQDTEQWTPLHAAACCAHKLIVQQLIAQLVTLCGANLMAVNADGNMPYDICDDDGTLDLIESEMAAQGITQDDIDEERSAGERHMLMDMKHQHQLGMPLDERDVDGATYLHVAAANGYYDVVAFLLRCGVSPSVRDNDLWQPCHAAACWAQPDIIELLAEYGADINAKTISGETSMDICEDDGTRAVIATLQAEALRRKRSPFGGNRDSRRQSRKRKAISKFESPQQPQSDSPFSARGAIRRLSLRDRSGMSLARLEARRESTELMRSWSTDFDPQGGVPPSHLSASGSGVGGHPLIDGQPATPVRRRTPASFAGRTKGGKDAGAHGHLKVDNPVGKYTPDEWLRELDKSKTSDGNPVGDLPNGVDGGPNGHHLHDGQPGSSLVVLEDDIHVIDASSSGIIDSGISNSGMKIPSASLNTAGGGGASSRYTRESERRRHHPPRSNGSIPASASNNAGNNGNFDRNGARTSGAGYPPPQQQQSRSGKTRAPPVPEHGMMPAGAVGMPAERSVDGERMFVEDPRRQFRSPKTERPVGEEKSCHRCCCMM